MLHDIPRSPRFLGEGSSNKKKIASIYGTKNCFRALGSSASQSRVPQSKRRPSRAMQSNAKQCKAGRAGPGRAGPGRAGLGRAGPGWAGYSNMNLTFHLGVPKNEPYILLNPYKNKCKHGKRPGPGRAGPGRAGPGDYRCNN